MKWYGVSCALLLILPPQATADDDPAGAARDLARKTVALMGRGETVSVAWRNVSTLGAAELARARSAFESAMREAGGRAVDAPSGDASVTLSENATQYLLVEEIRKGDERQVWIAAWNRGTAAHTAPGAVTIEKKLLWEQAEPILDAAFPGDRMVLLSVSKLTWFSRQNGQWMPGAKVDLPLRNWPRDPRGRLRVSGAGLQAFLPGMTCRVTIEPAAADCRAGDEPWVLESGARFFLVANFAAGRNHFDGRITTQTGAKRTVAPFYSAAAVEENGKPMWLMTAVDGGTRLYDAGFESASFTAPWGSDIAGAEARCNGGQLVLATRAAGEREPDAVQAFAVVSRAVSALAAPADLPGPVTALWPSGGTSVVAVVHDWQAGKYAAYLVTVACGA